jgi:hypothetical protein
VTGATDCAGLNLPRQVAIPPKECYDVRLCRKSANKASKEAALKGKEKTSKLVDAGEKSGI